MPVRRTSLEDFPDSAYAQELLDGQANMRFEASLEAAFLIAHLRRVRPRVRIWNSLGIVVAVAFTADQVRRGGMWNVLSLAFAGVLVPCALASAWLSWSRQYERLYLPFARVSVAISNALIAAFVARALLDGRYEPSESLAVILTGCFFFAGLMLRQALPAAAVALAAFAAAALAVSLPFGWFLESMAILTLTSGIAAIVCADVEQSHRRNFLQTALIAKLAAPEYLSGLMNRRAFDEHLLRMWKQAIRDQRPVALLRIDIDYFEQYVEQCGQAAGDFARRSVAKLIQDVGRRPLDLAACNGGEEFLVFLYDLESAHAQYLAERLCEAAQNLSNEAKLWTGPGVTVSVGVGFAVPSLGGTPEGAVRLADEALSDAKRAGRDCVAVKGAETYAFRNTGAFNRDARSLRRTERTG